MSNKTPHVRCHKCQCFSTKTLHKHHITYEPELTILLCSPCHSVITEINTRYAKNNVNGSLPNKIREKLHKFFMDSDIFILEAVLEKKRKHGKKAIAKNKKQTKQSSKIRQSEFIGFYHEEAPGEVIHRKF